MFWKSSPPAPEWSAQGAIDAIKQSGRELEPLWRTIMEQANGGTQAIDYEPLRRWKARTVAMLRAQVSEHEAERFEDLMLRPTYIGMEDPFELLTEHARFLEGLRQEVAAHPDHYGPRRATAVPGTLGTIPRVKPLEVPESVTLKWLITHVPFRGWLSLGAVALAIFGAGVRVGQMPGAVQFLSAIPGIEVKVDAPEKPSPQPLPNPPEAMTMPAATGGPSSAAARESVPDVRPPSRDAGGTATARDLARPTP